MPEIKYHYNDAGEPVEIEVDGERKEVTAEDRALMPERIDAATSFKDLQVTVRSTIEEMKDSYKGGAILVDIEATHFGYTNTNFYNYLASGGKRSHKTWTNPFGKPYIVNHDMKDAARGRVVGAKFVSTGKDTGYHALDTRIGHAEEIEMILDSRALTVSVGSRPVDKVECSVCEHDLFGDGQAPKAYEVPRAPSKDWLNAKAPGIYGMFGMTNEDFWNYREEGEGKSTKHYMTCRHVRGIKAPMGGSNFEDCQWFCHEQSYNEVSRVNIPADRNDATGEFAHIRGILKQTDGLDLDSASKHVIEELSRVKRGCLDRARFQVVSERDLFRASSAQEAVDYAQRTQLSTMFDTGQWLVVQAQMQDRTIDDQVKAYHEMGGRFISKEIDPILNLDAAEAFQLSNPREWGKWLRAQNLSRDEKISMDTLYTHMYVQRLQGRNQ